MRTARMTVGLSLALGALCGLQSCVALAAGAAGGTAVAYVMGEFEARLEASPQRVVKASQNVLEDMDIKVQSADSTSLDGQVVGKTALDKEVKITVKRVDDRWSKIGIRVGTFGDEEFSRQIYEKIKNEL